MKKEVVTLGDFSSEFEDTKKPEDASMLAVEDNETS